MLITTLSIHSISLFIYLVNIKVLHLIENMQVDSNDQQSAQFEQWLLDVGQGKDLPLNHQFTLP